MTKALFYWLVIVPLVGTIATVWFIWAFPVALVTGWYGRYPFSDAWEFSTELFSLLREAKP